MDIYCVEHLLVKTDNFLRYLSKAFLFRPESKPVT